MDDINNILMSFAPNTVNDKSAILMAKGAPRLQQKDWNVLRLIKGLQTTAN